MERKYILRINEAIKHLDAHADFDFVSKKEAKDAANGLRDILAEIKANVPANIAIFNEIELEVVRAETKHPVWPGNEKYKNDLVYAAAIVGEESGELTQAAFQFQVEGGTIDAVEREAIHTAATCVRLLKNLK